MSRTSYYEQIADDRDFFSEAEEIYRNDFIVLRDGRDAFPDMRHPWRSRPLESIRGLFLHHRAGWASYERMQRFVERVRCKPSNPNGRWQNRIAYTMGVHHKPDRRDGRVEVFLFNDFEAISWHSGSKGAPTRYWKRLRSKWGTRSANKNTVALNLTGFFTSRGYPFNIPEDPSPKAKGRGLANRLIIEPSTDQIRAAWGVYLMCQDLFPNFEPEAILGHKDSGKAACPGDTVFAFVQAVRKGNITDRESLNSWIESNSHRVLEPGYPEPDTDDFPSVRRFQWLLASLGYDLGPYGRHNDGVDGIWGVRSSMALVEFESAQGLLTDGEPDSIDYEALVREYVRSKSIKPTFEGRAEW